MIPPGMNWWGRNRASRMSCENARRHAFSCPPRAWAIGIDNLVHAVGAERALCGVALSVPEPRNGAFSMCSDCISIAQEVDELAGK